VVAARWFGALHREQPCTTAAIAALLGVDAGVVEKRVARLACGGGRHVAFLRARYVGLSTCRAPRS